MFELANQAAHWVLSLPAKDARILAYVEMAYVVPPWIAVLGMLALANEVRRDILRPAWIAVFSSRPKVVALAVVLLLYPLPAVFMIVMEHAAWTDPDTIAAYELARDEGRLLSDAVGSKNGVVYLRIFTVLSMVLLPIVAVAMQAMLWWLRAKMQAQGGR